MKKVRGGRQAPERNWAVNKEQFCMNTALTTENIMPEKVIWAWSGQLGECDQLGPIILRCAYAADSYVVHT